MLSPADLYTLEKKAGNAAARKLRDHLRFAIQRTIFRKTGNAEASANSRAKFKDNRLQRITMQAPHYIFKQHYGFEGQKKNGVNMRLKKTDVLNIALDRSKVLEILADDLAKIRIDQVALSVTFARPNPGAYTGIL
ncbi:hypothetical protein [Flavobacterium sp.]|uniref:hypothetical protein n=1 Tax=Flavobacterium sp. TaxID=239 RepID=UPI001212935D|nr:hypothetical protein [Flavobacterium sp.]RZJ71067.1 MAG: hypothetical protein EOO49_11480 [Flavobacterium sp.]